MTLSERLKEDADHIWQKIYRHPFVEELFSGRLPESKFMFYILQDYNYLVSSIRNFSLLASRAPDAETMRELVELAYIESTGEFQGYRELLQRMGLTVREAQNREMLPAGVSYTSFLLSTSSLKSFQEGITAVLPCYWSYLEIARYHRDRIEGISNDIYREWGSYYLEKSYIRLVERLRKLVDGCGPDLPYHRLKRAFITSSRYEYMFWDEVYGSGEAVSQA